MEEAKMTQERQESGETRSNQRAAIAALQSQLAQLTQERRPEVAPAAAAGDQCLVFSLMNRDFAMKAECIQGVERLADVTPVPHVAAWIRGVINLRGSIASVVDLRGFFGLEQLPYNPRIRLLSVQYNEMVICLVVDGVSEMIPIAPAAITTGNGRRTAIPSWAAPYAAGSAWLNERSIVLLDAARLLFSDTMQRYEALHY